jgi:AraC-like DNA-binding protein
MELSNDYLTLKLRRLKGAEEISLNGRGLLFVILRAGEGVCQAGPMTHALGAGDVLVLDSASRAKISARDSGEMVFWAFTAEFEHLFPLFSGREICLLQNVAEGFKHGRVYPASSPLAKECVRLAERVPAHFSFDHRSHVLRIVSAILTTEFKAMQPKMADFIPMRDHVLQVFEQLQTHELLSLSVGELAKKFSCSRRHLNRLFHQHFGVSVAALRMEMRLLKAVSLLVDPDAKIIYVAEKCGFNHLGLFNTCFKKRFGSSPSQWRKAVTESGTRSGDQGATGRFPQNQDSRLSSKNSNVRRNEDGPNRPLERGASSGLLRDIAEAKSRFGPRLFAHKEANGSGIASDNRGDRRSQVGA